MCAPRGIATPQNRHGLGVDDIETEGLEAAIADEMLRNQIVPRETILAKCLSYRDSREQNPVLRVWQG